MQFYSTAAGLNGREFGYEGEAAGMLDGVMCMPYISQDSNDNSFSLLIRSRSLHLMCQILLSNTNIDGCGTPCPRLAEDSPGSLLLICCLKSLPPYRYPNTDLKTTLIQKGGTAAEEGVMIRSSFGRQALKYDVPKAYMCTTLVFDPQLCEIRSRCLKIMKNIQPTYVLGSDGATEKTLIRVYPYDFYSQLMTEVALLNTTLYLITLPY